MGAGGGGAAACSRAGTGRRYCGSPTRPEPSWPPGSPALMRCPTPARCRRCWRRPPMFTDRLAEVIQTRVHRPERVAEAAANRVRPAALVGPNGRLVLVAADHPARGALRAGADRLAMADRADLLGRLCLAPARPR